MLCGCIVSHFLLTLFVLLSYTQRYCAFKSAEFQTCNTSFLCFRLVKWNIWSLSAQKRIVQWISGYRQYIFVFIKCVQNMSSVQSLCSCCNVWLWHWRFHGFEKMTTFGGVKVWFDEFQIYTTLNCLVLTKRIHLQ